VQRRLEDARVEVRGRSRIGDDYIELFEAVVVERQCAWC
jgi:hypothetical protein